jgi:hypothetical protein
MKAIMARLIRVNVIRLMPFCAATGAFAASVEGKDAKLAVSSWRNSRVEGARRIREIAGGRRRSDNAAWPIL